MDAVFEAVAGEFHCDEIGDGSYEDAFLGAVGRGGGGFGG